MQQGRKRVLGALRLLATFAVLGVVAYFLDTQAIIDRLMSVRPEWLAAALAAALPHYYFSALRWRYMTRQFGGDLSLKRAVPEYFLAVFLNQTLPGGVPGDLVRAWRDKGRANGNGTGNGNGNGGSRSNGLGRHTEGLGAAARGVLFERASGQITLVLVALVGVLVLPGYIRDNLPLWAFALVPLGLAAVVTVAMLVLRKLDKGDREKPGRVLQFLRDGRTVLFGPRHFVMHVLYSLPVVASFLGTFYLAGKALGVSLDPVLAVSAVPIVLLSMTVPITVGGWGVREGAAAGLWALVGLPASQGVAISVVYGVVILLSASPGVLVLLKR